MTSKVLIDKYNFKNFWDLQTLNSLFSNSKEIKNIDNKYIVGLSLFKKHVSGTKRKVLIKFNTKNYSQYVTIQDLCLYNLAYYNSEVEDIFLKPSIKFWHDINSDYDKNLDFKENLFLKLFHYKIESMISRGQRKYLKKKRNFLWAYKKLQKREKFFSNFFILKKNEVLIIKKSILNNFFYLFTKKILWHCILKSKNNKNFKLKGFILWPGNSSTGVTLFLGSFYKFKIRRNRVLKVRYPYKFYINWLNLFKWKKVIFKFNLLMKFNKHLLNLQQNYNKKLLK